MGCGIALPSLLLHAKSADITATDHHPEAEAFLERNTTLNSGYPIAFERTDWSDSNDRLGTFDLIIGSDLLYEDRHIFLLANFMNYHSKPACEIILVDPGRGRKSKLISAMTEFGYTSSYQEVPRSTEWGREFKGYIMKFER